VKKTDAAMRAMGFTKIGGTWVKNMTSDPAPVKHVVNKDAAKRADERAAAREPKKKAPKKTAKKKT
jgi:hypothetical protein